MMVKFIPSGTAEAGLLSCSPRGMLLQLGVDSVTGCVWSLLICLSALLNQQVGCVARTLAGEHEGSLGLLAGE
jgi:hypothetical protein